jgi:RHS repeat-associated protein
MLIFKTDSYQVDNYVYGRLSTSIQYDSANGQIGGVADIYDAHGRLGEATDARNGTTSYLYNVADLTTNVTTPLPGNGPPAETTTTLYDALLRPMIVVQPDNTAMTNVYLLTGELGSQYGSRVYPVAYGYDYAGRMQVMTNWSGFGLGGNTGVRVTSWNYDPYRGFLVSKTYNGPTAGPSYGYTPAGRLYTRTWARGTTTTNTYDNAGELKTVVYSDGTPALTNFYDNLARLTSAANVVMTDTLAYDLVGDLLTESFSGGPLNGLCVSNQFDNFLRRTNCSVLGATTSAQATYAYDKASRLQSAADGTGNSATYSYVANSALVGQIAFTNGNAWRMTTTKQYDDLNRLTQISSAPGGSYTLPLTFNYNYNAANQRTEDTLADGSYWVYKYDSLGQVTNGCKYFASGTPVPGQQFDYTFDTIGNRTETMSGGDTNGANLRVANYTNNALNQVTSRDVPAYVDVMGASILTNAITVNGQTAYRNQEYYRQQLAANNSASALWTNIIVAGGLSVTGNVYVAREPESFRYDADGNLTNDGRWSYTWDAENRLTRMTVNTNVGLQYQLTFAYDPKGRRIQKLVATNSGTAYTGQYTNNFLYDGWNLASILNPQSSILQSFVWGSDLSGSMQGAGGVGGLVEVTYHGTAVTNCFVAFDGNGNVSGLVNSANGTFQANYEYGPFGEVIRATGPMAKVNPFRFSTKYADDESDLLYYGYRYYKASTGTWINRDPIGESGFEKIRHYPPLKLIGGSNRYIFVDNNAVGYADSNGLDKIDQQDYESIEKAAKAFYKQYKKNKCFTCIAYDSVTLDTCHCVVDNGKDFKAIAHCLCYTIYIGQDTAKCEKDILDLEDTKW